MTFSLGLTILGSWALLITRLQSVINSDWALSMGLLDDNFNRYLDWGGLTMVILGLFLTFYYRSLLNPRFKRLEELGEGDW
ncbi:MAG: hypothetical protein LBV79_01620 [Candidatus Adiutrix sp.]|jgi:hypothetical protein|nr:hypothetical protein [Candidatus Adiutrix sp.]